jgi:hypothetical protein
MNSEPSPGDGFIRMFKELRAALRRLTDRHSALVKRVEALEDRVTDLEGGP